MDDLPKVNDNVKVKLHHPAGLIVLSAIVVDIIGDRDKRLYFVNPRDARYAEFCYTLTKNHQFPFSYDSVIGQITRINGIPVQILKKSSPFSYNTYDFLSFNGFKASDVTIDNTVWIFEAM